ncbi:hypothetical protein [Tateyamaria sp.]|uniref:hypothetical protein n=1 Tax=Tateyamaria sp. TaxID=1929288 RepID=UPI003B20C01E
MVLQAEFDRPEVTITKPQICKETGVHPKTVQKALKFLKKEGFIKVIYNGYGGRSNALSTYRFLVPKGAHNAPKGAHNAPKGAHNAPPTIDSIDSMSADAARQTESSAAGRDESWQKSAGHNTGGGEGIRWNFAEKQQNGTWRARSPEEMMQDPLFALAYELTGYYGTAKELFAKWVSGKKPVGEI